MKRLLITMLILLFPTVLSAGEKTLEFQWGQVISDDFAGWHLYMSTSPNVQVVPANLFTTILYTGPEQQEYASSQVITSPNNQEITYYFILTAFDNEVPLNESGPSNEVSQLIDFLAPDNPFTLTVTVVTE